MKWLADHCPDCNEPIYWNEDSDCYEWNCQCFIGRFDEAEELLGRPFKETKERRWLNET